jgi:hypothetical protein
MCIEGFHEVSAGACPTHLKGTLTRQVSPTPLLTDRNLLGNRWTLPWPRVKVLCFKVAKYTSIWIQFVTEIKANRLAWHCTWNSLTTLEYDKLPSKGKISCTSDTMLESPGQKNLHLSRASETLVKATHVIANEEYMPVREV